MLRYVGIELQTPQDSLDKITSLEFAKRYSSLPIKLSPPEEVRRCCEAAKAAAYVESGKEYAIPFLCEQPVVEYCSVVPNDL